MNRTNGYAVFRGVHHPKCNGKCVGDSHYLDGGARWFPPAEGERPVSAKPEEFGDFHRRQQLRRLEQKSVHHIDGDPDNNDPDNLELRTTDL